MITEVLSECPDWALIAFGACITLAVGGWICLILLLSGNIPRQKKYYTHRGKGEDEGGTFKWESTTTCSNHKMAEKEAQRIRRQLRKAALGMIRDAEQMVKSMTGAEEDELDGRE